MNGGRRYPFRVCTLIPAYNAERALPAVLERVRETGVADRILVVDDGSTDNTVEVVRACEGVTLVCHEQNKGYGAAQTTLMQTFQQDPDFDDDDIGVFLHSDGEMLPEEMGRLVAPFVHDLSVECVCGSRSMSLARHMGFLPRGLERPLWKRGLDKALTVYLNTAFGLRLSTYFGGYRAMKRGAMVRVPIERFSRAHAFDIQFLAFAAASLEMREVPVTNVENQAISHYSGLRLLQEILRFAGRRKEVIAARKQVRWW
jgi:glycosyltransferase involved in cell wall biosynthesis